MAPIPRSTRTGLPLIPKGAASRSDRCDGPAPRALLHALAQFNNGAYWECHETLEELWRHESDPVRYLYQGILLVGVGLYHLERANQIGAVSKLRSGLTLLEPYAPVSMGVDVAGLRAKANDVLARVERGDDVTERITVAYRHVPPHTALPADESHVTDA